MTTKKNKYLVINNYPKVSKVIDFTFIILFLLTFRSNAQITRVPIGKESSPTNSEVTIKLVRRYQHYNPKPLSVADVYDNTINSPKSVNILDSKKKFYINSLEGKTTSVYSLENFKLLKSIKHVFHSKNQSLFLHDSTYTFKTKNENLNYFNGLPVESCFSHNGKYLWITYYRRSFDINAIDPSAVCIIDTDFDSIVRVITVGPLPKMISCSPDNKTIAVSHWGDNTVSLIDISSNEPKKFSVKANIAIDQRLSLNYSSGVVVDRDNNCGNCLRGTVFTPDGKYAFIGKMGGNGVAILDVAKQKYIGTVTGMKGNMRHLVIKNSNLYLSINKSGFVQKTELQEFIQHFTGDFKKQPFTKWQNAFVGIGARTIALDNTGDFLFAAVNNESKISIVRTSDMKVIAECPADSYPVGMDVSEDGNWLIVTAQGKKSGGGNSVMVYEIKHKK
jgi:DNA-binding beta-propeller fold protein YncE